MADLIIERKPADFVISNEDEDYEYTMASCFAHMKTLWRK